MAMEAAQQVSGVTKPAPLNPLAPQSVPAAAASRSKALNPLAAEFVPRWLRQDGRSSAAVAPVSAVTAPAPVVVSDVGKNNAVPTTRPKPRRMVANISQQGRTRRSARENAESARRTIYVTNIDPTATEKDLADRFWQCGAVLDCRICRNPTKSFVFAFIEFQHHDDASAALHLKGVTFGDRPLKVAPSRTAIIPVNPSFLAQSAGEKEMCSRTVYCTNIEKRVTSAELVSFFQAYFGSVSRVRLLGDDNHVTSVAFVEFAEVSAAIAALRSIGIYARDLPIRVSPSKTPIRN